MISFQSQNIICVIFGSDSDPNIACADVLEHFERQAAVADESSWAATNPHLYQHVRACGHCAAAYDDLQWVLGQTTARTLVEPAIYPPSDLSFLSDPLTRLRQQVGQVTSRGYYWLQSAQGTVWLSLAQYLQTRAAHTATKDPSDNEHLVHLACEPDENLAIELIADAASDGDVTITTHVRQPDRFHQGYGGTEVSLHFANQQRTGYTNDAGRIVFASIPADALPELVIQVTPFDCVR